MSISLGDLMPAKSLEVLAVEESSPVRGKEYRAFKAKARARLIAQEYVRNGMDLPAAYAVVTGTVPGRGRSAHKLMGHSMDDFMTEVGRIVSKSDIEREKALSILWAMIHASILDFFDDNGRVLSIVELKKLPRVMQMMLSKVKVSTVQDVVMGPNKKPMLDDNGSPYLKTSQKVEIEIPEKMAAINQLAQIMRWVGPLVKVDVNVNVGRSMVDADARTESMGRMYEGVAKRLD